MKFSINDFFSEREVFFLDNFIYQTDLPLFINEIPNGKRHIYVEFTFVSDRQWAGTTRILRKVLGPDFLMYCHYQPL